MEAMATAMATTLVMTKATRWRAKKRVMARAARLITMAKKRAMVMAARAMVMARNEGKGGKGKGHGDKGVGGWMATSAKRVRARAARMMGNEEITGDGDAIATAMRVVGVKEGNDEGGKGDGDGDGNREGNGNRRQQHGQRRQQRGWQASNGSDNDNGEGDGTKDMAAHTTPGERGMMVAMGHGLCVSLCVCGETTKNTVGPKNINAPWSMEDTQGFVIDNLDNNMLGYGTKCWCGFAHPISLSVNTHYTEKKTG
jgi:hypothetical protein